MRLKLAMTAASVLLTIAGPISAQAGPDATTRGFVDHSPHQQRWIAVAPGVRIETLEWGRLGPSVLLVPGYGFSAHVYDDLAALLARDHRVVAITVRGWPPSDAPGTGYTYDSVAADIGAVIDTLQLGRVVLAGHSFGGSVIARTAIRYPDKVRGLIFIDGALQQAARDSVFRLRTVSRPPPAESADTTLAGQIEAWHRYAERYFYGTWTQGLEADLWARGGGVSDSAQARRDSLVRRFGREDPRDTAQVDFGAFSQPALAICALTTVRYQFPWLDASSADWEAGRRFTDSILMPFQRRECALFGRQARRGTTEMIESGHYIFINRPERTLEVMRRFLDLIDRN